VWERCCCELALLTNDANIATPSHSDGKLDFNEFQSMVANTDVSPASHPSQLSCSVLIQSSPTLLLTDCEAVSNHRSKAALCIQEFLLTSVLVSSRSQIDAGRLILITPQGRAPIVRTQYTPQSTLSITHHVASSGIPSFVVRIIEPKAIRPFA
jgi:hypothetical protein